MHTTPFVRSHRRPANPIPGIVALVTIGVILLGLLLGMIIWQTGIFA